jgi:hypothetical protein
MVRDLAAGVASPLHVSGRSAPGAGLSAMVYGLLLREES